MPLQVQILDGPVRAMFGSKVFISSVVTIALGLSSRKAYYFLSEWYIKRVLRKRVKDKRNQAAEQKRKLRAKLQDKDGKLVNSRRQEIVSLGIHELVEKLQNGELTCLEVLHAYQAKALEATEQINCITEFITEAEEWAMELDKRSVKGPLHGVPFSVKETYSVIGYDKSFGIAKTLGRPAAQDATIVAAFKALGALPFCRTNIPQLALSYASSNPVWGETRNPFGLDRTPGGSSSGDASLVGAGASLFSLGTDIGGSLRVPASLCAAASLKATPGRILPDSADFGLVGLTAIPGIIARDVHTLAIVSKLLWSSGFHVDYNPCVAPIPCQEQLFQNRPKLRIGYYEECSSFPVTPGVKRALQTTRRLLIDDGHDVVPFNPPGLDVSSLRVITFLHGDSFRSLDMVLKYEDVDSSLSKQHWYGRSIPWMLRPLAASIVRLYSPILAEHLKVVGGRTTFYSYQLWNEMERKTLCRQELIRKWKAENLDLCIGPVFVCPAPKLKDIGHFTILGCYTTYYNYVDLPAGSVHVTMENEQDQELLKEYPTNDTLLKLVKETTKGAVGLPIGVQVIALPFQEEAVLHGMKLIEDLVSVKKATRVKEHQEMA